jgi:hypothetical protein
MDDAVSALLNDLESRGLLASTLVVVATEFGADPEIDQNAGRNHHRRLHLPAGRRRRAGRRVYGETDDRGHASAGTRSRARLQRDDRPRDGPAAARGARPRRRRAAVQHRGKDDPAGQGKPIAALF